MVDECAATDEFEHDAELLPGDKLYVKADDLILFDTWVAKITAPWERIFGFTILGNATVRALQSGAGAQGGGIGF